MEENYKIVTVSKKNVLTMESICPFCLAELRAGVPENGECGHEELLVRDLTVSAKR